MSAVKWVYYSLRNILKVVAHYYVIFGERSNGKTYQALLHGLEKYVDHGGQTAIQRRMWEDFRQKRGAVMYDNLICNSNGENMISVTTKGEWDNVYYYSGRWYLSRTEEDEKGKQTRVTDDKPFSFAFAISAMEHDKSTAYPNIDTVIFDEFMTRGMYLRDEFTLFMNSLSTIIRHRENVEIFMLANTVNQYCPYFKEMGLRRIKDMKPGDIDLYTYGDSGLRVAVEFADGVKSSKGGKPSNVYFAFDNPQLNMITGKGSVWEMALYPHLPMDYFPAHIKFMYFIVFDDEILQCEIIFIKNVHFTYIHRKTGEIKYPESDLVFSIEHNPKPNWRRRIDKCSDKVGEKIWWYYKHDRVFYQDNEVGELVRNYLQWCGKVVK